MWPLPILSEPGYGSAGERSSVTILDLEEIYTGCQSSRFPLSIAVSVQAKRLAINESTGDIVD